MPHKVKGRGTPSGAQYDRLFKLHRFSAEVIAIPIKRGTDLSGALTLGLRDRRTRLPVYDRHALLHRFIALTYSDIPAAKRWWINTFDCKVAKVPADWDNPLPSDVALKLPDDNVPTILLSARAEVEPARFDRPTPVVSLIFCDRLSKAHEQFSNRGILVGPNAGWRRYRVL